MIGCKTPPPQLNCSIDIEALKENIKSLTNADTVLIYTKTLKEEVYFPEIRCTVIIIENATTKTLNFKNLPVDKYQRFENFDEIGESLKLEGYIFAKQLIEQCDMTDFNDLIIEFHKKDRFEKPIYRFICHYKELFSTINN